MSERTGLQTANPPAVVPGLLLQRKCACGNHSPSGECEGCEKKRGMFQRKATGSHDPSRVPSLVDDVLSSPGQPLDRTTRAFMEPRFGHDLSHVRVHTNAKAAESALRVNALAYTIGRNVVFGRGQFAPDTTAGRRLLAHELTHVAQQAAVDHRMGQLTVAEPEDREEKQASENVGVIERPDAHVLAQPGHLRLSREPLPGGDAQPAQSAPPAGGSSGRPVFFCSKPIMLSSLHGKSHAFFRVGGTGPGNPTYELEHDKSCPCAYQGWPRRDDADDFNATTATCISAPAIAESCLAANWNSYPVGKYCAWGPNSNTYTRVIAERCGATGLRPPGNVPGFDDPPPVAGTGGPNPFLSALTGICITNSCDYFDCPD